MPTVNSYTVNNTGLDGAGFPDTTTDPTNPQPFAATNRITTTIAGITDGSGNAITPIQYTNPVTVVSSAVNALAVTDTVTGNIDNFTYDGTGTLTVSTTNKLGAKIGLNTYSATGLSAVASDAPTVSLVDGSGSSILSPGSGPPIRYTNPVTVTKIDQYNMMVADSSTGNVDTYSANLDTSNNPVQDAQGNYLLTVTHADSLGRNVAPAQTLSAGAPGVNSLVSTPSDPLTIAADGANTSTSLSRSTILPRDSYTAATGSNGNNLNSIITDGSGVALSTYTDPVAITNNGAGTITVTAKNTGLIDRYTDNGDSTVTISHTDSAGDITRAGTTVSATGLNAVVAQTQTLSFSDGNGNPILDTNGTALPVYSNPVSFTDTSTAPDKSYKVTDGITGNYDTYKYASASQNLTVIRYDNQGNQLSTQAATGVSGFNVATTPITITNSAGGALTDTMDTAAPVYSTPVSIKDAGGGNFSITDSSTGYVDQYSYDTVGQTLTISHNDNNNNTLSTQSFIGVNGIGQPWASMQAAGPTTWNVFNKTTQNDALSSNTSYNTSYDTSNFNIANPTTPTTTANAYTSSTTFAYTTNNIIDPATMQEAMPNLKLNYVVQPKITVSAVTDVPMPATLEPATQPYDINTNAMPKWEQDAVGFIKAGTPYMLDFDPQGNLVSKQLTGDNVIKFNTPQPGSLAYSQTAQSSTNGALGGLALMLSTFA